MLDVLDGNGYLINDGEVQIKVQVPNGLVLVESATEVGECPFCHGNLLGGLLNKGEKQLYALYCTCDDYRAFSDFMLDQDGE